MPRWRKNNQKINISCLIVPIPSKTTQLVDYSRLCNLFNIAQGNLEYSNMKQFPLCSEHYGILYRQLNPTSQNCRTCSKVINDTSKSRKCPNPSLIQQFLSDNQDFVGTTDEDDMFVIHAISRNPYRSNSISEKRTEVFNSKMDKAATPEILSEETLLVSLYLFRIIPLSFHNIKNSKLNYCEHHGYVFEIPPAGKG